jgi:hypothetical protein
MEHGRDPVTAQRPGVRRAPARTRAPGADPRGGQAVAVSSNQQRWDFVICTDRAQLGELSGGVARRAERAQCGQQGEFGRVLRVPSAYFSLLAATYRKDLFGDAVEINSRSNERPHPS